MKKKLDLKIYGVITIGPKGQIMIPKEARNDIGFETGGEYSIFFFDEEGGFGLGKDNKMPKEIKTIFDNIEIIGITSLNAKHQFVIPVSIREKLNLKPGDNIIAVGKGHLGLGFIKNNNIEYLIEYIKLNLN